MATFFPFSRDFLVKMAEKGPPGRASSYQFSREKERMLTKAYEVNNYYKLRSQAYYNGHVQSSEATASRQPGRGTLLQRYHICTRYTTTLLYGAIQYKMHLFSTKQVICFLNKTALSSRSFFEGDFRTWNSTTTLLGITCTLDNTHHNIHQLK